TMSDHVFDERSLTNTRLTIQHQNGFVGVRVLSYQLLDIDVGIQPIMNGGEILDVNTDISTGESVTDRHVVVIQVEIPAVSDIISRNLTHQFDERVIIPIG